MSGPREGSSPRLTLALAATTLAAATAAIYYAHAWQQLRDDTTSAGQPVAESIPAATRSGAADAAAEPRDPLAAPPDAARPVPGEEAATRVIGVGRDPVSLAVARHRLAGLRDPQQRALRVKELVDIFLSGGWEIMAPQIGITDQELMSHLEARAQRVLDRREQLLECQLADACDVDALRTAHNGASGRDEQELLGPARYARIRAFQQSSQEYQFAREFSRRLPAGMAMSSADVSRLALALAEERQRFRERVELDGLRGMSYVTGSSLVLNAAAVPGAADEHARRRESAGDYARRLSGRAAAVLTPAQFQEFRSVLDAELAFVQSSLRDMEAEAGLRGQAGQSVAP